MGFTKKDIEKLALLARIKLTDEEKERFASQITSILEYVKQVEEVDTSSVSDAERHTINENVTRGDEVYQYKEIAKIIDQWPEKYGNLNKVKRVFE